MAQRDICVDLPEEGQDVEHCGLLVKPMFSTQDALAIFQDDHTQVLENAMHQKGTGSPALLYNESEYC